jgi:hypothetical protein
LRSARHFLAGELLLRHFHPAISAASSSAVNNTVKKLWIGDQQGARKRVLLRELRQRGHLRPLVVVPMVTEVWSDDDYRRYLESLGDATAQIGSRTIFARSRSGNPSTYLTELLSMRDGTDFFFDLDSGITERIVGGGWSRWKEYAHVAASELTAVACAYAESLLLVYDHTVMRSGDPEATRRHAAARVEAFSKHAKVSAMAWFWERERQTDPVEILGLSCTAQRIAAISENMPQTGQWNGIVRPA